MPAAPRAQGCRRGPRSSHPFAQPTRRSSPRLGFATQAPHAPLAATTPPPQQGRAPPASAGLPCCPSRAPLLLQQGAPLAVAGRPCGARYFNSAPLLRQPGSPTGAFASAGLPYGGRLLQPGAPDGARALAGLPC